MNRFLRNLPIKRKLTVINVVISSVALAIACATFAVHEQDVFRDQMQRDFGILAEVLGDNVASGLAFDDPESIRQTLSSLAAHPRVAAASVYGSAGNLVAEYRRVGLAKEFSFPELEADAQRFTSERLDTFRSIELAGEKVGMIYVGVDLAELKARAWRYSLTVAVLLIACSLVALALASRLQKVISDPIVALAQTAGEVATGRNYAVRARKESDDETGRLIDAFNGMLDQIQARDQALQDARDQLELRVESRTKEVVRSLSLLSATLESTTDGILAADLNGRIVSYNKKLGAMWNLPPELLQQHERKPLTEHAAALTVDPEGFLAIVQERMKLPEVPAFDSIELKDGRTIERHTHPQLSDGRTIGVVMSFRDVTERKEAEAKLARERDLLRVLLDSSPDTIYFKDRQSRFVRVSKSETLRYLGRVAMERRGQLDASAPAQPEDANHLIGLNVFEVFGPELGQRASELDQEIMRTGQPVLGLVEKMALPGGREVWHLTDELPWRDETGRIIGTFGISKDITAMKAAEAKLAEAHRQLLDTSRRAGMAEVATGVLHNVGNVLNSVNVSTTLLTDQVRSSRVTHVGKICELLRQNEANLATFFTDDPRGRRLPAFLETLATHLSSERETALSELEQLRKNVEHIKDIVAMQQNYAKVSGVTETVQIIDLVEDAVRMNSGAFARHDVALCRDYQAKIAVTIEKHKVLQILVNLMRNAKYACDDSGRKDKQITLSVTADTAKVRIAVIDNGVGIAAENLTRIFNHGFTTRRDGHGFGLHSGALAARELGGSLIGQSDGPGHGARFILELPLKQERDAA